MLMSSAVTAASGGRTVTRLLNEGGNLLVTPTNGYIGGLSGSNTDKSVNTVASWMDAGGEGGEGDGKGARERCEGGTGRGRSE
jgi:hypothetical protein